MHRYIIDEKEFIKSAEYINEYTKNYENPRIGLDFETYSLVNRFPHPIPYYGLDKDQLEQEAFERTGMRLRAGREGEVALFQVGLCPLLGHDDQFLFDARLLDNDELFTTYLKEPIERATVIGHNLTYEAEFLIICYNIWMKTARDTRLLGRLINAGDEYKHDLAMEYRKFFDPGWFFAEVGMSLSDYSDSKKKYQVSDWTNPVLSDGQLEYAAQDVRLPMFLYDQQKAALKKLIKHMKAPGLANTMRLNCDLINEFALMSYRGVPLNVEYQVGVSQYLENKMEESLSEIAKYPEFNHEIEESVQVLRPSTAKNAKPGQMAKKWEKYKVTQPINIRSNPQLLKSMEQIGVPVPNTKEKTLKEVRQKHPAVNLVLRYRKAANLNSNYGMCMIDDHLHSDGKLHPIYNIIGARTSRQSGSDPNMMKIPQHELLFGEKHAGQLFRTAFEIPDDEWVWISADKSQIEPRMIFQITRDIELQKELIDGDIHSRVGQVFMNLSYKPAKGSYERDVIGKTGGLQTLYKAGAKALSEYMYEKTIDLDRPVIWSIPESQDKIDRFWETFSQVREYVDKIDAQVRDHLDSYESLRFFQSKPGKKKRPVYEMVTFNKEFPVYKKWVLSQEQEKIAREQNELYKSGQYRPDLDPLHKWYKVWDDEKQRETYWNDFNKAANVIGREGWNLLFQGDCATAFKYAILNISRELSEIPTLDPREEGIIFPVHDEVNLLVRNRHKEQAMEIVERCLVEAGERFIQGVPVKVEIKSGKNWAECH